MVAPFMPHKAAGLRQQLCIEGLAPAEGTDTWPARWGQLEAGTQTQPGEPLFHLAGGILAWRDTDAATRPLIRQ